MTRKVKFDFGRRCIRWRHLRVIIVDTWLVSRFRQRQSARAIIGANARQRDRQSTVTRQETTGDNRSSHVPFITHTYTHTHIPDARQPVGNRYSAAMSVATVGRPRGPPTNEVLGIITDTWHRKPSVAGTTRASPTLQS